MKQGTLTFDGFINCIPDDAFRGNERLTSIKVPNSIRVIGHNAFSMCSGLVGVTFGNSVHEISDSAFQGCEKLTSITIPDSVKLILPCAFSNCIGLGGLTIPDSVTSIGSNAFHRCSGLTSVKYKAIKYTNAYELLNALKSNGVSVDISAFSETGLDFTLTPDDSSVLYQTMNYTSSDEQVITPNTLDGWGANLIGNEYK